VITGYAALVDPVRYGYALSAYVYVDISQRSWKSVRGQLLSMPAVDHVALLSGEHDIVIRVRARDAVSLRDTVLTRLQEIPEVRSTQTVLIFEEATPGQQPGKGLAGLTARSGTPRCFRSATAVRCAGRGSRTSRAAANRERDPRLGPGRRALLDDRDEALEPSHRQHRQSVLEPARIGSPDSDAGTENLPVPASS
jgi:tRNA threonylcarbamoyladenosine modification (KEOPS) complex  Pcc1 subunit